MKTNYHTHTYRCGHAVGTEKQMVEAAINMNMDVLGMCDHVPLPHYRKHLIHSVSEVQGVRGILSLIRSFLLNGIGMRMPYGQMRKHLSLIEELKEKHKDEIVIYKGFEAEGLEEYFDYYQKLLNEEKVDYLILGHHFQKYCIHNHYYGRPHLDKEDIYAYCDSAIKAMETGLFSYFAHPDIFLKGYKDFDEDAEKVSYAICQKAKELSIPLEINAGGIRQGAVEREGELIYAFPNTHFFKIASEVGNQVVLGFDAHSPKDFDDAMYYQLQEFAKNHQLEVVYQFPFAKGKKHYSVE